MSRQSRAASGGVLLIVLALSWTRSGHLDGQDPPVPPILLFAQGVAAFNDAQFEKARSLFASVVANDARHAEGRYYLGVCEAKLRNYAAALLQFEEAVACDATLAPRLGADESLVGAEADRLLAQGVRGILERLERREQGDVTGSVFEFVLQDAAGKEHVSADFVGAPLVVLFLDDSSGNSLDAALLLDRLRGQDQGFQAVGIVQVRGKTVENQVNALERYVSTSRLTFPLLLSNRKVEQQLRPFRRHPTALFLDALGRPRRIVEGHGADLETRYQSALRALTTDATPRDAVPKPDRPTSAPSPGAGTRPKG
ncbi:MAG: hypothetical protein AB7O52_10635 [Planctomycetota bacterium]